MQILYKGNYIDIKKSTTVSDLLKKDVESSELPVIACKFNNEIKSLDYKIDLDGEIELIDIGTKDGMRVYRRGLIYIISKAINEIYPNALLTVNYQLHHALLCEIDNMEITDVVINNVNEKVQDIIKKDLPITKKIMSKQEAIEFYEKEKTLKGKIQLDLEEKKEVTLYYCEEYYNYFYGVMPISTGYITNYELMKYHDGFLIRFPSSKTPNMITEFHETPKLLETLDEYEDVHKILNINTLYKLNKIVKENNIKDYILLDEALHEKKIAGIADTIAKNKNLKVILIAGPSSSGKTTFAKRLDIELRLNGLKPLTISVDNYFVEREQNPVDEHGKYDFEAIEAIDTKLLNNDLLKLLNGETIQAPTFNFSSGDKEYKGNTMKLEKDQILIMEGIHCLNDKLTYLIPKDQKFKIYISALTVLNIDYYNRIPTTDTRLIRRIVRDRKFRNYDAIHTLEMWASVTRGEAKNIFPYQEEADLMFNSSLIYEMSALKNNALPLLNEIKSDAPQFTEAKRLVSMLKYFEPISTEFIPSNSLLREFIGGSIFE